LQPFPLGLLMVEKSPPPDLFPSFWLMFSFDVGFSASLPPFYPQPTHHAGEYFPPLLFFPGFPGFYDPPSSPPTPSTTRPSSVSAPPPFFLAFPPPLKFCPVSFSRSLTAAVSSYVVCFFRNWIFPSLLLDIFPMIPPPRAFFFWNGPPADSTHRSGNFSRIFSL